MDKSIHARRGRAGGGRSWKNEPPRSKAHFRLSSFPAIVDPGSRLTLPAKVNMRFHVALRIMVVALLFISCGKDDITPYIPPATPPVKKVLLKDITIPSLPSPYYHFEYNGDSMATKVEFASGYSTYDVLYNGDKISEMRHNIIV